MIKYNLEYPEKQQIILKRLPQFDEKGILDLFHELKDDMTNREELDNFVVQAMIIVQDKVNKENPMHQRHNLAEHFIRQYSNKERLPVRLTLYRIIK
ncbi:MAG: hypothetical protein M0R77_10550 [Gammaproteobacteria bacterium]|nr:hypothetical protein [Gammaproteobacteria bacterium]